MNVTPNGDFGYGLEYFYLPDGLRLANFVPADEEHPLEPGVCECGAELRRYDGGFYILHKKCFKYLIVPDSLPEGL